MTDFDKPTAAQLAAVQDLENKISKAVVAEIMGKPVTRAELSAALDIVADKTDWKNPINTVVDLDRYTKAMVKEAVWFFTGSLPRFQRMGGTTTGGMGRYRVKAAGYYSSGCC
jgi:hypothetical protein